MIVAGDILGGGVYPETDVRVKPLRDLEDGRLLIRCEHHALLKLLLDKGLITTEEYTKQLNEELKYMIKIREQETGIKSTDIGLIVKEKRHER